MTQSNLDEGRVSIVTLWSAIIFAAVGAWVTGAVLWGIKADIASLKATVASNRWTFEMERDYEYQRHLDPSKAIDVAAIHERYKPE